MKKVTILGLIVFSSLWGFNQIKMHPDGDVTFGTVVSPPHWDDYIYSDTPYDKRAVYLNVRRDQDWHHSITTEVGRNNTLSYVVRKFNSTSNTTTDKFYVFGTGTIYASGTYYSSDQSIKENIERIEKPLSKLTRLRGVSFNYTDDFYGSDEKIDMNSRLGDYYKKPQIGLIAQEVEEVLPEVVITNPDGIKAVAYQNIVALLIEGVKHQQAQIDSLETLVRMMSIEDTKSPMKKKESLSPESESFEIEIAPNPFSNTFTISYALPEGTDKAQLNIYSPEGQLVISKRLRNVESKTEIDMNEFVSGSYIYALVLNAQPLKTGVLIKK